MIFQVKNLEDLKIINNELWLLTIKTIIMANSGYEISLLTDLALQIHYV